MKVKYAPPEPSRWAFMEWTDIPSRTDPTVVYLRRLRIVQTPWWAVYLHWINEPDTDRHPHDHPWVFWSLILRGGYTEAVHARGLARVGEWFRCQWAWKRTWRRWSWHRMPTTFAHSITSVEPGLVTLVVTGRRVREWCFWTEEGLVPWHQYLASTEHNSWASTARECDK